MNQDSLDLQENHQFEALIQGLIDQDYGCCNDFLSPNVVTGLLLNLGELNAQGVLKNAGIGVKETFHEDRTTRGDKINWIQNTSIDPFEVVYLRKMEKFISYLNKTCFTALTSYESHYSCYAKNSVYKRHIDQFKTEKGRQFSTVLYLNDHWKEEDGGCLSLYPKDKIPTNISPLGGRLVFFRSDEMEHEVRASTTRTRNSIAGWLKN
ncbi:MAG: 2OG-Fe(II) oxygenase [Bacteroidetes bacterium]|nr:2OG-Fe(II) oxygenase [Bacteroidota bacterium]